MRGLSRFLVVLGALLLLIGGGVTYLVRGVQESKRQADCAGRLRELGRSYAAYVEEYGIPTSGGGVPFLFALVGDDEATREALRCGSDTQFDPDLAAVSDLDPLTDTRLRSSYMARDFGAYPVDPEALYEVLAVDAGGHHESGVFVLYCSGEVAFWDRNELRLYDDPGPIVIGSGAVHVEMQKVCLLPR